MRGASSSPSLPVPPSHPHPFSLCPPALPFSGWSSQWCWQVASSWDDCQVSRWRSQAAAVLGVGGERGGGREGEEEELVWLNAALVLPQETRDFLTHGQLLHTARWLVGVVSCVANLNTATASLTKSITTQSKGGAGSFVFNKAQGTWRCLTDEQIPDRQTGGGATDRKQRGQTSSFFLTLMT